VLCTDGFYGSVAGDQLQRCVSAAPDPHAAAHRLIEEAYRNGSSDNITVAVIVFAAGFGMGQRTVGTTTVPQVQLSKAAGPLWPDWRQYHAERRHRRRHSWLHRLLRFVARIPPHTSEGAA
jgi:hypothetical protein